MRRYSPLSALRSLVRRPSLWLFVLMLAAYSLTFSGDFSISDGEVVFQTIVALADHGSLTLECHPGLPQIVRGIAGQCFSKYGLGMPLLALLPFQFGRWVTPLVAGPGTEPIAIGHFAVSFLNLLVTAAGVVVFYWYARDLYRSRWLGLSLALVYGLATSAWPYSKVFFSEPLIAFLLLVTAYALYRCAPISRRQLGWPALAGLALGYAVLTKVATVTLLPVFGLYLLWSLFGRPWPRDEAAASGLSSQATQPSSHAGRFIRIGPRIAARQALRRPTRRVDPEAAFRFPVPLRDRARLTSPARSRPETAQSVPFPLSASVGLQRVLVGRLLLAVTAFALPIGLCGVLLLWHNLVRFGSLLESGYSDEGFTTPLYVGLYGMLFSSGKSVFLFSPPVLLGVAGIFWLWRRHRADTLLIAGLVLATLLYYSAWWAWYGGWSWGPRFLVPVLPFLILPIGALLSERVWARWALVPLVVAGIGVQLLGALVDFNPYIVEIIGGDPANEPKIWFYPWFSPLIGHLRYLVKGQHLLVNAFDLTRLGFRSFLALLFPLVIVGALVSSVVALALLHRPRRRTGGTT